MLAMDCTATISVPIYIVDAFTSHPFAGNPAAVCIPNQDLNLSDALMQNIASENNISETAYISGGNPEKDSEFNLRWFTPTNEVNLCGHATLATSAVLFKCLKNPSSKFTFHTLSGDLTAEARSDGIIYLGLPLVSTQAVPDGVDTDGILRVLNIEKSDVYNMAHSPTTRKLVIHLNRNWNRVRLESMIAPNPQTLQETHDGSSVKGVLLTVEDFTKEYDFLSRYFAPWNGIGEDPVTGSAHTVLGPYWSAILNKDKLFAKQCSPRGGDVHVQVDSVTNQVIVGGDSYVVQEGSLLIPRSLLS